MTTALKLIGLVFGAAVFSLAGFAAAQQTSTPPPAAKPVASAAVAAVVPDAADTVRWCGEQAAGVRALSDQLRRRAAELDEREQTVALREATLTAAAKKVEERLDALAQAESTLDTRMNGMDAERQERIDGLVKMVESNRAGSIVAMIQSLEPELAVQVLDRMNRAKAGKLLAQLPGPQAAALAARMTDPIPLDLP